MALINTLVNVPDKLSERLNLLCEFRALDLPIQLDNLKTKDSEFATQAEIFVECWREDEQAMRDNAETAGFFDPVHVVEALVLTNEKSDLNVQALLLSLQQVRSQSKPKSLTIKLKSNHRCC